MDLQCFVFLFISIKFILKTCFDIDHIDSKMWIYDMVAIIEDRELTKQHIFIFTYVLLFLWIYLFTKSIQFFG